VDVEVIFPRGGKRTPSVMKNVNPRQGSAVTIKVQ
jgi:hypothetical protein